MQTLRVWGKIQDAVKTEYNTTKLSDARHGKSNYSILVRVSLKVKPSLVLKVMLDLTLGACKYNLIVI